ncbi:MAG: hypothetical protein WB502_11305 [Thermoactinomyces sp.]
MRLLLWSAMWIGTAFALTAFLSYISYGMDVSVFQRQLQTASAVFFIAALIVGGVFTTNRAFHNKKRFFCREEWSFICILVTIGLFTLSLMFS